MEVHGPFEMHTCTYVRFEKSGHVMQADESKCFSTEDFILGPSCDFKIHAQEQEGQLTSTNKSLSLIHI